MNTGTIVCYIAPDATYFNGKSDVFDAHTIDNTKCYTVKSNVTDKCFSYAYGENNIIYPGRDGNLEKQYKAYGTEEAKKYPLFTLNQAMKFLRRFRSNGTVTYLVKTQYGEYGYGTVQQTIRLLDASGGSTLRISPFKDKAEHKEHI